MIYSGVSRAAHRGQTSVDELLRIKAGSGRRAQEGVTNTRYGAGDSFKSRSLIAGARRLRKRLHELDAHRILTICAFSFVPCETRWTIKNQGSTPSPLSIIILPTKDTSFLLTGTGNEAPRGSVNLIVVAGFSFEIIDITRAMITALLFDSLVEAVVHIVLSLNFCSFAHQSF